MKICFLTHNVRDDNGAGVFSLRLIRAAQERGHEVIVLTSVPAGYPFEQHLLNGRGNMVANFFKIRRAIRRADIVHALDGYPYGVVAQWAGFGLRKKIIITAVGTGAIVPLYRWPDRIFLKLAYRRANAITAISSFSKNEILKKAANLSIEVITHGVDIERFVIHQTLPGQLMQARPYILSVGSLRWRKGYQYSIRGFAEVHRKLPHLRYVIVGKKYTRLEFDILQKLIKDLDLQEVVTIVDYADEDLLVRLYKNAEMFCLLSQNDGHDVEGFGLVFLEAAAAGLPVIGSMHCGVEEAMQDGRNGYLVESKDVAAFAKRAVAIMSDSQLRHTMGKASNLFASQHTWDEILPKYFSLYDKLAR